MATSLPPSPSAAPPTTPTSSISQPDGASGHLSVAHLRNHWYVACESHELRHKPLARTLLGSPLVLFRGAEGVAGALLDRCPHRNVPLSLGQVVDDELQCGYHGWRFDEGGICRDVPALCGESEHFSRNAVAFATVEQDGYVWVYAEAGAEPDKEPYRPPAFDEPGYTTVRRTVEFPGTLHATLENALDVPHTAFLHKGLFRGTREPIEIDAVVTRTPTSVQTEYIGEPRPSGVAAKILSPSGGIVTHFDRFELPSIAQVEYRIGDENHFLVTSIGTPVSDFLTRVYAVVSFRTRLPAFAVKPIMDRYAMSIFRQDQVILGEQTEAIQAFGGERFISTELDLMGGQIWQLLRREETGRRRAPEPDWRKEIKLQI